MSAARPSAHALRTLERIRDRYGPDTAAAKLSQLALLERSRLRSADAVRRLHEALCFLRAYPDSRAVLRQVDRMLARFDRRTDVKRFRDDLAHSGIAGTVTWFPYFWPTARWMSMRWPALLQFDRADAAAQTALEYWLPRLVTPVEGDALRETELPGFKALDVIAARAGSTSRSRKRAEGRGVRHAHEVTDATFLLRRIDEFTADERQRESIYDAINPSCELLPGRDTPSRTRTLLRAAPAAFRAAPLRRERPDLRTEGSRPPRALERLPDTRGAEVIEVARATLAVRQRDLDAFAHGNAGDVWLADDGLGLSFALVGMVPTRRAPIYASYGLLTLQNGLPIGYGQADVAGRLAALSFNSFETFRGGETALVFARFLAALRALFGVDTVSLDGYQLGHENDEAIASGAWWFYAKLGFVPRSAEARRLLRVERQRLRAKAGYRSSPDTLRALARSHLFFDFDPARPAPLPDLAGLGARVAAVLARRTAAAGVDRDSALETLARETLAICAPRARDGWSHDEWSAWQQWSALLASLPLRRWPARDRASLVDLVRAKAAPSELAFARGVGRHARLARALLGDRFVRQG